MSIKQPYHPPSPQPPCSYLTEKTKMEEGPNQNQMKNTHPLYIAFEVWKVYFIIICEMQSLYLLFLVFFYITSYISRYHFSLIFRASYNTIWKKDFCHEFPFFNGFTQPRHFFMKGKQKISSLHKIICSLVSLFLWYIMTVVAACKISSVFIHISPSFL